MANTTASAKTILFVIYEFEAALLTARDIYLYPSRERRSRSRAFKFIAADYSSPSPRSVHWTESVYGDFVGRVGL